jgi:adenylate kinase
MRKILFALIALALVMPAGLVQARDGESTGRKVASGDKAEAKKKGPKKGAKKAAGKQAKKAVKKAKKPTKNTDKKANKKADKKRSKVAKKKAQAGKKASRSSAPRFDAPVSQAPAEYKEPSKAFDVPEDMKDDLPPPNNGDLTE